MTTDKIYADIKIIGVDDWMIFGRTSAGRIVETCCEMWHEWLDFEINPSDMNHETYLKSILQIMKTRKPGFVDVEKHRRDIAAIDGEDEAETIEVLEMIFNDIASVEARDAAIIQSF